MVIAATGTPTPITTGRGRSNRQLLLQYIRRPMLLEVLYSSIIASVTSEAGPSKSSSAAVAGGVDLRLGSFAGLVVGAFAAFL